jgi:hypothetical protein
MLPQAAGLLLKFDAAIRPSCDGSVVRPGGGVFGYPVRPLSALARHARQMAASRLANPQFEHQDSGQRGWLARHTFHPS